MKQNGVVCWPGPVPLFFIFRFEYLISGPKRYRGAASFSGNKIEAYRGMYHDSCIIERFSYDLEMKAREQNRKGKRTEIEQFDWFMERTDKRAWLFIG